MSNFMDITKGRLKSLVEQYKQGRGILRRIFGNQKQIKLLENWVKTELRNINDTDPVPEESLYHLMTIIYARSLEGNPRNLSYQLLSKLTTEAGITQPQIPFLVKVLEWLTELILATQRSPANPEDRISTPTLKSLKQSMHKVFEHPVLAERIKGIFQTLKKLNILNPDRAISVIYRDEHMESLADCFNKFYAIPVPLAGRGSVIFIRDILRKENFTQLARSESNPLVIQMQNCVANLIRSYGEKPSCATHISGILGLLKEEKLLTIKLATAVTENGMNAYYIKLALDFLKEKYLLLFESHAGIIISQGSSAKDLYICLRSLAPDTGTEAVSRAIKNSSSPATAASPGSLTPSRFGPAAAGSPDENHGVSSYGGLFGSGGGGAAAAGVPYASTTKQRSRP